MTEQEARRLERCPVCGDAKTIGAVVCWGECWRGADGLKYSGLTVDAWLALKSIDSLPESPVARLKVQS